LGISAEVYDALIENKEICWFCIGCNAKTLQIKEHKEDKVLTMLEKMMDKLNGLEEELH